MNEPPEKEKRPLASKALNSTNLPRLSQNENGTSPKIVDDLRELLGADIVLLPIQRGDKGPSGNEMKGWPDFTPERMADPEYLAQLNHGGNIGVLLGKGLTTIDIDRDENVESFLNLNPKLSGTLRTRRVRGCNAWLRINGDYPKSCKLKTKTGEDFGEWRADGNQTVIHGEAIDRKKGETKPTAYEIENHAPPVELAFHELKWPDDLLLPWESSETKSVTNAQLFDELRQRYGEPFYRDERGQPASLNESFWAGLYATENFVLWEPLERAFYGYRAATGIYEEESADATKRQIADRMLKASRDTNCLWLQKQRSDTRLNGITNHLRGIIERRGAFMQQERRLVLANGVFSFENGGELLRFSPDYISRNRSPIAFDENARCDRFLNELVVPAVHVEDVPLLQKYFGLSLLGNNLIQRMLILDGEAARGKTQFANVVQAVVGRENTTQLRTRFLGDRFELFRLLKKTLLVGVDVESNFLSTKGAAVLKGLVGGDWFDAEQKGGTGCFPVQGTFCAVVTSNSRLRVHLSGDVGAWRRRLLIVRYEAPAPKRKIPDFGAMLVREEGSGILNWGLAGLDGLLRDVEATGDIVLTDRQQRMVDNLLAESDSLRGFLKVCVEKLEGGDVTVSEIVEAYAAYCPNVGWNPLPITEVQRALEGLMLELFRVTKSHGVRRDGKSLRGFLGVELKP